VTPAPAVVDEPKVAQPAAPVEVPVSAV